jgi:hypothetical protein
MSGGTRVVLSRYVLCTPPDLVASHSRVEVVQFNIFAFASTARFHIFSVMLCEKAAKKPLTS